MMKGGEEEEEAITASRGGGAGRGKSKKVPKFTENEKENFSVYGGDVGLGENKSPLPVGYPRTPLQDITAVLRPVNGNSDEEGLLTGGVRKPVTRCQGLRKIGNVHTTALSERISKHAKRAGPSKTQKKQAIKIVADESKTVTLSGDSGQETTRQINLVSSSVIPGDSGQLKQETTQQINRVSSSVIPGNSGQLKQETTRQTNFVSSSVILGDSGQLKQETTLQKQETTQQASIVSSSVNLMEKEQKTEAQSRRKPLSERSSVSRFR